MLVSSSSIAIDLYKTVNPNHSPKQGVIMMRLLCMVFIALSLILALLKPAIILSLMAMSWGAVAGFFIAPYMYGLFWRRATTAGAWIGGLSGLSIAVVFDLYYKLNASVIPLIGSVAMLVPLAVLPLVSLLTKQLPEKHLVKVFGSSSEGGKDVEMFTKGSVAR